YLGARKLVEAAQQTLAAARAEWYPTLGLNGYYGDAGPTLNNSHRVFSVTAALNFNIDTGRIRADISTSQPARQETRVIGASPPRLLQPLQRVGGVGIFRVKLDGPFVGGNGFVAVAALLVRGSENVEGRGEVRVDLSIQLIHSDGVGHAVL